MTPRQRITEVSPIESGIVAEFDGGGVLQLTACTDQIIRVRLASSGQLSEGGLERYGFIRTDWPPVDAEITSSARQCTLKTPRVTVTITKSGPRLRFSAGGSTLLTELEPAWSDATGFGARFALPADEQFTGFGDQTRDRVQHRGHRARMWGRNVNSYCPIPFFMSSKGYGLFVNSTWRHVFDMGATSDDWFGFAGQAGQLDYFFIHGPDSDAILDGYTQITGRPYVPPLWSFGLWYICHTHADARAMLDECLMFRDRGIPCDVVGLEPGWMKTNYDFSVDKSWHPERFSIPPYCPNGPHNFLNAARRMGFKPMLWLCCDYDLSIDEERRLAADKGVPPQAEETLSEQIVGAFEEDEHLWSERRMDSQTKPDEAWFDHLKKFVDQGVELFKQDGANQVLDHPDRKWANGMDDEEMHNLYPLLYSRQMYLGFKEHTGRRPTPFTPSGFAGMQRWTGTWAGDTGGGPKPLVSMLNLSLSGHGLVTCDMEVTTKEGIHFGFLQPWAQLNNWNYWRQPWYQGEEIEQVFREYCALRYRLLPYLYSMAHIAHRTGMPILRAMPLMYPDDEACANLLTQYMLGDSLLVSAYTEDVHLPEGRWYDYWTGEMHAGPCELRYTPPAMRGGGLFMKAGSIIPVTDEAPCVPEGPWPSVHFQVAPGGDAESLLIEDDGITHAYEHGQVWQTRVSWSEGEGRYVCRIEPPDGATPGVPEQRRYTVRVLGVLRPQKVLVDGIPIQPVDLDMLGGEGCSGWEYCTDLVSVYAGEAPWPAYAPAPLWISLEEDPRVAHEITIYAGKG